MLNLLRMSSLGFHVLYLLLLHTHVVSIRTLSESASSFILVLELMYAVQKLHRLMNYANRVLRVAL